MASFRILLLLFHRCCKYFGLKSAPFILSHVTYFSNEIPKVFARAVYDLSFVMLISNGVLYLGSKMCQMSDFSKIFKIIP